MIIEKRQFWFTQSSLINALKWYASTPNRKAFPAGTVVDLKITQNPTLELVAIVDGEAGGPRVEISFLEPEIIAILIYFCKTQKIPIPRQSEKKIVVAHGTLILQVARKNTSRPPG